MGFSSKIFVQNHAFAVPKYLAMAAWHDSRIAAYYSEYIQRNPLWIYAGVYADNACTGTRADRPEFQRLLMDCRAGKIEKTLPTLIQSYDTMKKTKKTKSPLAA